MTTCPINYFMRSLQLFQKFSRKDLSALVIRSITALYFAFSLLDFYYCPFIINSTSYFNNSFSRAILFIHLTFQQSINMTGFNIFGPKFPLFIFYVLTKYPLYQVVIQCQLVIFKIKQFYCSKLLLNNLRVSDIVSSVKRTYSQNVMSEKRTYYILIFCLNRNRKFILMQWIS